MATQGTVIDDHAVDDCPLGKDSYRPTAMTFDDACRSVLSVTGPFTRDRTTIRRLDSRRLSASFKTSGPISPGGCRRSAMPATH